VRTSKLTQYAMSVKYYNISESSRFDTNWDLIFVSNTARKPAKPVTDTQAICLPSEKPWTCPVAELSGTRHRSVRTNQSRSWVVTFMSGLNLRACDPSAHTWALALIRIACHSQPLQGPWRFTDLLTRGAKSDAIPLTSTKPTSMIILYCRPNPCSRTMALRSTQPRTEMSIRNLPGSKGRSARKADNLTAICEPTV
jgi:hypothetical protein